MPRARTRPLPGASRPRAFVSSALLALGALLGVVGRSSSARAADAAAPSAPAAEPAPTPPAPVSSWPEPAPMGALARERYEEGLRLYGARDFAGAIQLFEEGFALEPRREFLFAEAQAHRLAGDCARAVPLYQRFLETAPSPIQVDATRLGLDRCAKQEAAAAAARTAAAAPSARVPPEGARGPDNVDRLPIPAPAPARTERRPFWLDPPGLVAAGAGVAALGVGIGYWVASNHSLDQASSRETPNVLVYDRLHDTAVDRRTIAIVALAAGGAALVGGLARLAYVRPREVTATATSPAASLALAPTSGGAALLWQGRY